MEKPSKARLAIILSHLKVFEAPKVNLEQYPLDSESCASLLWFALMKGDIENRTVLDLGTGNGILGIGARILGAKEVILIDIDPDAIKLAQENSQYIFGNEHLTFLLKDVQQLQKGDIAEVDTVLMNPPFGVQQKHADRAFLIQAFRFGKTIYSIHKEESLQFLHSLANDHGFRVTDSQKFSFPLKKTLKHHTSRIYRFPCVWVRFEKN